MNCCVVVAGLRWSSRFISDLGLCSLNSIGGLQLTPMIDYKVLAYNLIPLKSLPFYSTVMHRMRSHLHGAQNRVQQAVEAIFGRFWRGERGGVG
jgi:hypothetical protein